MVLLLMLGRGMLNLVVVEVVVLVGLSLILSVEYVVL